MLILSILFQNATEKPSASKLSETPAPQPAPRSGPAKKAPRPWGPLSKRKPTATAEAPDAAAANENQTDKAYLEEFDAPECFVDINAEMQAQMEAILAGMSDECGERVNDLQRHKQDVHAVQGQKRFACEKCPAVYVHKRTLWQHTKDKHCRKSKGTLVLPPEHDGESDENTMTIIISHDLAEKIANSIESLENHGADDQEGFNQAEVAPENVPGPTEEPIDVGNADDFYQNLRFDLEMAKMDNSSMELDLHLSDASDPVLHEDMENILIIDHNDDGGLFTGGHLSVGKNNATGQNCDDVFVDIESIDDEGA